MTLSRRPFAAMVTTLFALSLATAADAADSPAVRCKREIAKRSAKYAQTSIRALAQCADAILQGRSTGPCPDAKATRAIAAAATKLQTAVAERCGGPDRSCGTTDDLPLATIGWDLEICPGFGEVRCIDPIASC